MQKKVVGVVVVLGTNTDNFVEAQTQQELPTEIQVLKEFNIVFQEPKTLPPEGSVDHAISLMDMNKKINQSPYRLPHHQKDAMEELIKQMLQNQMIRPSISPYSSPMILVKKKDGTRRMCVDYRQLNPNTIKNKYPIPIIEDLLDELFGAQMFKKLISGAGYHQIRMKEADIEKIAFTTHLDRFEYLVTPFGLTNAPATFQSLMNTVLADFLRKFALVFFDNILIYSTSMGNHV